MKLTRVVYGLVVFLSAFLLFTMEPMAAKRLLPLLGGSSAVWITCLVFFQTALLAGYLYAYWMARQSRVFVHLMLSLAALIALAMPLLLTKAMAAIGVILDAGIADPSHPVGFIFGSLALTIGLAFVLLSSTNPLLQVWWVRHTGGPVPYRLFALSNAGSLLALALYPTAIEPNMELATQRIVWVVAFVAYLVAVLWLAKQAMPGTRPQSTAIEEPTPAVPILWRTRALWFLLPMAACMQLAAVTSHLSQDVAAIPLLWLLPLGVYLLTFIVAFQMPWLYRRDIVSRLLIVLLAAIGYALSHVDTRLPVGFAVLFYLVELFIAGWFCHAETYELRPGEARASTTFYVTIAAGGAAGTFLVAIASPLVFRANYDLPLAFLFTAIVGGAAVWKHGWSQRILWSTVSVLLVAMAVALQIQFSRNTLMRARNFYGSLRVTTSDYDDGGDSKPQQYSNGTGPVRVLMNGRIRHGTQMMSDAEHRKLPTTYYGTDSGVGVTLRNCCGGEPRRVGVVGLGAGTLAAYGQPGDTFRFYEINPLVEPIARNLFTYLRESRASVSVVTGDGRLALQREPAHNFDVIVVDAFAGDAIPLHLLTREAMQVYLRQLAPAGVIAFHVSNSYVDLAPEIARVAESLGLEARNIESFAVPAEGAYRATWVLVTANRAFLTNPSVEAAATPIRRRADLRVWTDDYSSLLPVLRLSK
jgi:spermidine synthase